MMRAAIPLLTALLLTACGADPTDTAADPEITTSPSPTAAPTVGTYPVFPHDDYEFTVAVGCFCPDAGEPIRITVTDGVATAAEWVKPHGHAGRDVPDYWAKLTMDAVIDAANETEAARVDVRWPTGQEYPDSVWVDRDEQMADEEIGYTVSEVVTS